MNLNTNIGINEDCNILIQDVSDYITPNSDPATFTGVPFIYDFTASIDAVFKMPERTLIGLPIITYHNMDNRADIEIPSGGDGWILTIHIVIPDSLFYTNLDNSFYPDGGVLSDYYTNTYYYDLDSESVIRAYRDENNELIYEQVDITEFVTDLFNLSTDPKYMEASFAFNTNEYIAICYLRNCFINLSYKLYTECNCDPCNNTNSDLVYRRDLVYMAINTIKYLLECEEHEEAEKIIRAIHGCNGICHDTSTNKIRSNGCGCSG